MTLVVIAIFDEVYEGEIAASLLRSADIPTFLLGDQLAKIYPFEQRVWGGVRLAVPDDLAAEASEIIDGARSGTYALEESSDISRPEGSGWSVPVALLALFGGVAAAWGLSGLRRRPSLFRIVGTVFVLIGFLPFVLGAAMEALYYFVTDIAWLLDGP